MLILDENNYCRPQNYSDSNVNCQTPPSPAESNGRPLNFVVYVCFVRRIGLGCFVWRTGWICRPLIEQTDVLTMYNGFYLRLGITSIGHARHVKTRNDNGFGYFHKNYRFLWGKNVSKTNLGSTIHYTYTSYITNISDFVWFQRSCGSMKSVSSFSSIKVKTLTKQFRKISCWRSVGRYSHI